MITEFDRCLARGRSYQQMTGSADEDPVIWPGRGAGRDQRIEGLERFLAERGRRCSNRRRRGTRWRGTRWPRWTCVMSLCACCCGFRRGSGPSGFVSAPHCGDPARNEPGLDLGRRGP